MSFEFNIRRAGLNDASQVKNIEIECNLSPWTILDYRNEVERENSIFLVNEFNGGIIGFLLARLITIREYHPNDYLNNRKEQNSISEVEIHNIGVRENFRRYRAGKSLLLKLIQIAQLKKVQNIWLEVRKSNSGAFEFYSAHGFEFTQSRKNLYTNPVEDGYLMRLQIGKDKKT